MLLAVIKDSSNQNHVVRNLRLDFRDLRTDGFVLNSLLPGVLSDVVKSVPVSDNADDCSTSASTDSDQNDFTPFATTFKGDKALLMFSLTELSVFQPIRPRGLTSTNGSFSN